MKHTVVFLGPSLPRAAAREILDAEYRPPVKRGDLKSVPAHSLTVIIDGEFDQNLSVSPKEILDLIGRGATVLGASSMGALRAAELDALGMTGVGWVYEQYSSGRVIGDDEVALLYAPTDYHPLTVPLINVRFWLDSLRGRGQVSKSKERLLLRAAAAVFYAERTPRRLDQALEGVAGPERLGELYRLAGGTIPDIKADDAGKVLHHASRLEAGVRHTSTGRSA